MDSQIEEIKNRLNVVDVVGSYVKLRKTGANYSGVCPFHSEKKPSFFVSPVRQMWRCFGCGVGGDIFKFVMQIEGIEFGDALRMLAQKAGVELKRQDPRIRTERQRLYEICDLACLFFEKQLEGSVTGQEVKKYLLGRGINEESIKKWRLGYSPETWQGLSDFLVGKGYNREEIERAGLAIKSEKSQNSYDRFRGRIMFPVFDLNSQPIGFGARVFKKIEGQEEGAKYINTPQTPLYDKSRTLYGLNFGKVAVRKNNQCVITEGYTDVIMAHQAGFENTVAASGTALTSPHLDILKRYAENLLLAFDMDIAGDTATKRGIDLAQERGFNIKIIKPSAPDTDPADVILKDPKEWEKSVTEARTIMDYYFDSAIANFDKSTADGKKSIAKALLPAIKKIPNMIEQSFWVQKLSSLICTKEEIILEEMKKVRSENVYDKFNQQNSAVQVAPVAKPCFLTAEGRKKIIEEKIISLILKDYDGLNLIDISHLPFFSESVRKFLEDFKKFLLENPVKEKSKNIIADFASQYSPAGNKDLEEFLTDLSFRAEVNYEEDSEEEIQLCLEELKTIGIKDKLRQISENLKKAEQTGNIEETKKLVEEFNQLSKQL